MKNKKTTTISLKTTTLILPLKQLSLKAMPLKKEINKEERAPPKPENVATKTDTDKPKPLTDTEEQTATDTREIVKEEKEPSKPVSVAPKVDIDKPKVLTGTEEQTSTDTKPLKTEEYSSELKQVMIFFRKSKHIKLDIRTNIYITNPSCNLMLKKY